MSASHSFQTEYKLEEFHGMLRWSTFDFLQPEEVIKIAQAIAAADFDRHYSSDINHTPYSPNYTAVRNQATPTMAKMFIAFANNVGKSSVCICKKKLECNLFII